MLFTKGLSTLISIPWKCFQENKLTQLESSVESEEKKWQDKLSSREQELEQVQNIVKMMDIVQEYFGVELH